MNVVSCCLMLSHVVSRLWLPGLSLIANARQDPEQPKAIQTLMRPCMTQNDPKCIKSVTSWLHVAFFDRAFHWLQLSPTNCSNIEHRAQARTLDCLDMAFSAFSTLVPLLRFLLIVELICEHGHAFKAQSDFIRFHCAFQIVSSRATSLSL